MNKQNMEHMFINMHMMHKEKMLLICLSAIREDEEEKVFISAGGCVDGLKKKTNPTHLDWQLLPLPD